MTKKAIYPGSFDPFTNGHLDIVRKAAALFDEVYVIIGVNAKKNRSYDCVQMKAAIEETLAEQSMENVFVVIFEGLVADYAKVNGIRYMIRGIRNNMDYNYEESIAEVNKLINPGLEYVYFRAEHIALSSSMVKELHGYGQDVSQYVPKAIFDVL